MNLFLIFLTGLTTGGLSCLAMQGGLLASLITNQKDQEQEDVKKKVKLKKDFSFSLFDQLDWLPVGMFLVTKLITHTFLGFLLGLLGSAVTLSLGVRLAFQVFTAVFMFATAMNLLNVHPIFRFVALQPPKFLQRRIRNSSKSKALFAPAVLGALTVFIPCGVTQAMEVLAINTGNPVSGALLMFAFVLGTSPLFALLGVATAKLSEGWYLKFTKFAAYSLVAMAIYGLNGVLIVINSPITIGTFTEPFVYVFSNKSPTNSTVVETAGVQQMKINVLNNGYQPNYFKVKVGKPVELTLTSDNVYTCALSFVFKEFNIKTFLSSTDTQTITFTPTKTGKFPFSCSMGMYTGTLEVI